MNEAYTVNTETVWWVVDAKAYTPAEACAIASEDVLAREEYDFAIIP